MKIGIMGGTFDPIHNGHLMLGEYAYHACNLDEVWFMPNGNPPHKENSSIESGPKQRAEMVGLAIAGKEYFKLNLYEVNHEGVCCTYQTMEYFCGNYPEHDFYYIIGADSLFAMETWVHPERIFPLCTILAAYRDDIDTRSEMDVQIEHLQKKYRARVRLLETPLFDIASHELRKRLKERLPISEYVPEAVEYYIRKNSLYVDGE